MNCTGNCNQGRAPCNCNCGHCDGSRDHEADDYPMPNFLAVVAWCAALWTLVWLLLRPLGASA